MGSLATTLVLLLLGCGAASERGGAPQAAGDPGSSSFEALREAMVSEQLQRRGIRDRRVLDAMRRIPRHLYAPDVDPSAAYDDRPQSIGHRQTISQPYIVALMTELARIESGDRVLEVGTGSGYQAAVLGELAKSVHTIEIVAALADEATRRLTAQGYTNVTVRGGDGYAGWPEHAPFDAILVTAAAPRVPEALLAQLAPGGRLVIPVDQPDANWGRGGTGQTLDVYERTESGIERTAGIPVRFVPMTGSVREP